MGNQLLVCHHQINSAYFFSHIHDDLLDNGIILFMIILPIQFTDNWHNVFLGGHIGLLLMGSVDNRRRVTPLDDHKRVVETSVRENYGEMSRAELQELRVLKAYYRQFKKSYHVQLQLESVAHKGKNLPAVNPLVDACFAAELQTHLLTASHDVDKLVAPVTIDVSTGQEELVMMNGHSKQIKAKDMIMTDANGVVCTIIYGQDKESIVIPATSTVLYVMHLLA